jgi:hypothetical protein
VKASLSSPFSLATSPFSPRVQFVSKKNKAYYCRWSLMLFTRLSILLKETSGPNPTTREVHHPPPPSPLSLLPPPPSSLLPPPSLLTPSPVYHCSLPSLSRSFSHPLHLPSPVAFKYKEVSVNATALIQRQEDMDMLKKLIAPPPSPAPQHIPGAPLPPAPSIYAWRIPATVEVPVWTNCKKFWSM